MDVYITKGIDSFTLGHSTRSSRSRTVAHATLCTYKATAVVSSLRGPLYRYAAKQRARATSVAVGAAGLCHHNIITPDSNGLPPSGVPLASHLQTHPSAVGNSFPISKKSEALQEPFADRAFYRGTHPGPPHLSPNTSSKLPSQPAPPSDVPAAPPQQPQPHAPTEPHNLSPSILVFPKAPHGWQRGRKSPQRKSPKQLTASLLNINSLPELLSHIQVCGLLNAVQLCAAFSVAESIAANEGGDTATTAMTGGGGNGNRGLSGGDGGPSSTRARGLCAPPCRTLTKAESTALADVLAAHAEVLADADPPELAVTLWAAARLRLRLPTTVLELALEAVWMWDPADPIVNHQPEGRLVHQTSVANGTAGRAPSDAPRRSERVVMGPGEVCLLLYATSVLWPEYVRQNAGGFLEALDSYETAVMERRREPHSGVHHRRGGLTCEQVVGVVAALARSDAPLDEVEEEFILQAVSSRLTAFSMPHLTSLLSAAQTWDPLRVSLHRPLLTALLVSLEQHHIRFMEGRRVAREQQQQPRQGHLEVVEERPQHTGSVSLSGGKPGDGGVEVQALPLPPGKAVMAGADESSAVARGLIAALRSGVDPNTGMPLSNRLMSDLLRQVRLRAPSFSARDVCEALRAMVALSAAPAVQLQRVARWKEGVRGLLRRWVELLTQEASIATLVAVDGGRGAGEVAATMARTFASSLHAVGRLGVRLHAAESDVAVAAVVALAPYMCSMADCVMTLTGLEACLAEGFEETNMREAEEAAEEVEHVADMEGGEDVRGEWIWLDGSGVRQIGSRGRNAVQRVLERAAVLMQQQQRQLIPDASGGQIIATSTSFATCLGPAAGPGELVCLIRIAASVGAWPPEAWWSQWRQGVVAALPPSLRPPSSCAATAADSTAPQSKHPSASFSFTEAVDVLYSLARLTHLIRKSPSHGSQTGLRRWKWRRLQTQQRGGTLASVAGGNGCNELGVSSPVPLERDILTALLAVACMGYTQLPPRGRYAAPVLPSDAAVSQGQVGAMSIYLLTWAVGRLQLVGPREAAMWGPRLAAAAPHAFARLTPRKQVLLLRSLTAAFRSVKKAAAAAAAASTQRRLVPLSHVAPLPQPLVAAWLAAFAMSMSRARGQTLAYAAVAVAAAGITPPLPWMRRFRGAMRRRVSELSVHDIAALVAGLRLHRRQTFHTQLEQQPQSKQQMQMPQASEEWLSYRFSDVDDLDSAGLARALLKALKYMLAATVPNQQPPQPEFHPPPPLPTKQQRKSPSQSQPLCAVERQLARRLSCLLMRGAAASHPMGGAQRSLLQPQPPALQQQENHSVEAAVVGGSHTLWLSTKAGSDISSSIRPVGVVLAPRPAVVIRRRGSVERIFRLPAPSPDVSLHV